MPQNTPWQDFMVTYYSKAMESAEFHLGRIKKLSSYWDDRINEHDLLLDVVISAMESTFKSYDPTRGAAPATLLSHVIHNKMVDELKKASRDLGVRGGLEMEREGEYTLRSMVKSIPEDAMDNLKARLREAIKQLEPIDQTILGFYLENPKTFIKESVNALNVPENFVSGRKNKALKKLPKLMGVTKPDYFNLFETRIPATEFLMQCITTNTSDYVNPIYPAFNLDSTVAKLYEALVAVME